MDLVRIKTIGPRNSNPVIHLTRKGKGNLEIDNQYAFIRGAVVWPCDDMSGFVLVAGKERDNDCVEIFKEIEFKGLHRAVEAFIDCSEYLPSVYYFHDIPENQGFISHLRKYIELSGKLPFAAAPNAEGIDYGNNLIQDYLVKKLLIVPPDGALSRQLQEVRQGSGSEQFYSITALRYLLQGIDAHPWHFEVLDLDFNNCTI